MNKKHLEKNKGTHVCGSYWVMARLAFFLLYVYKSATADAEPDQESSASQRHNSKLKDTKVKLRRTIYVHCLYLYIVRDFCCYTVFI